LSQVLFGSFESPYLAQKDKYGNSADDMLEYQVVVSLNSSLFEVGESEIEPMFYVG
jgi:hypothetical protein